MSRGDGDLLLDTHVWIWLLNGQEPLASSPARERIQSAAARGAVRVAVMSVWEVGMLEAKGRISFPLSCEEWVRRALAAPGLAAAPLTADIALASTRLPGEFHGDPADRIIVATARQLGATLVTKDRKIRRYGALGHVSVLTV